MQLKNIVPATAALVALSLGGLPSHEAKANPYETYISIDSEDDLYDLQATGQIEDETLATLVELLQLGIDLNTASRDELYSLPNLTYTDVDAILEYRRLAGWISDPIDLVVSGVLTEEKLSGIAAFLIIRDRVPSLFATDGRLRTQTRWSVADEGVPPLALQARVGTLQNLTVGVVTTLSRNSISDVRYDATRDALSAAEPSPSLHVPKVFVKWETDDWGVIAGTYRIGFGQRLTFDNTSHYSPNGFYLDDEISRDSSLERECKESAGELAESPCGDDSYVSPDYRWSDGLLGVAAGVKNLELGAGHLQAYGFGSYQPRSIYQYEIYRADRCDDPRSEDDECKAPNVYRRQDDVLDPTSRFSFHTLPNIYADITGGGNVSYSFGRRGHVGVTGYGNKVDWRVDGIELDFQEWARYPIGGSYGAIGVDGGYGVGPVDLFGEVTRSVDSDPEGGGDFAGIVRAVTTLAKRSELETSVRYYGKNFKNPFAGPISAPDEYEGARARDEVGLRFRYTGQLDKRLSLRGTTDLWRSPTDEITSLLVDLRTDLTINDQYTVGLWALHQNKDLTVNGTGLCYEVSTEEDENGEPVPCAGEKYQVMGRVRYTPTRDYSFTAQYQHKLLADKRYPSRLRQDSSATGIATAKPIKDLRLRARVRYLFEDISDNMYLEQSIWAYLDATYRLRLRDSIRLRYDIYAYLDERDSTLERTTPEHWLWLEYESRF